MAEETTTIRISKSIKRDVQRIAAELGESQVEVISEAVTEFRKKMELDAINVSFSRLSNAKKEDYEAELEEWDSTLSDGLDDF